MNISMKKDDLFDGIFTIDPNNSADKFLLALLTLLKVKSYNAITISELCAQANLSRKTFYKNFSSKEALLDYLYEDFVLAFHSYKFTPPNEITNEMEIDNLRYFTFWYHMREWVHVLVKNDLWFYINRITPYSDGLATPRNWGKYLTANSTAKEMLFEFFHTGRLQLVQWWCLHDFSMSPFEVASLVSFVVSGRLTEIKKLKNGAELSAPFRVQLTLL